MDHISHELQLPYMPISIAPEIYQPGYGYSTSSHYMPYCQSLYYNENITSQLMNPLPVLDHLAPAKDKLQHSISTEDGQSKTDTNLPISADNSTTNSMPLTVRISMINLKFMKLLESKSKSQIKQIQDYYYLKSAELESKRFTMLALDKEDQSTNACFDQQHHGLLDQTEKSLQQVQEKLAHARRQQTIKKTEETSPKSAVPSQSKSGINPVALKIMTNWYERNTEHPYPSYETADVMAKAGNISVDQVKKWFANRRLRLGNTKNIKVIAKRRKRAHEDDDITATEILMNNCKRARSLCSEDFMSGALQSQ